MTIARYTGLFLHSIKWGDLCLISLFLSLLSGLIIGYQYDPKAPYYSTAAIDLLIPYGPFFRSLHFYSSQCFFLTAVIHFIAIFNKLNEYHHWQRIYLVLTLPVILMLLFTGYLLRGDSTGTSAGAIAEHIMLSIPLIGSFLNDLLFSIEAHGLDRVYMHHIISFDLLLLFLAWNHLRRYRVQPGKYILFIALTFFFCFLITAPLDPEHLSVFYITGPWFFLGLQELLRYVHPFIAGILAPLCFLAAVTLITRQAPHFIAYRRFILIWLFLYLFLSLRALYSHSPL